MSMEEIQGVCLGLLMFGTPVLMFKLTLDYMDRKYDKFLIEQSYSSSD